MMILIMDSTHSQKNDPNNGQYSNSVERVSCQIFMAFFLSIFYQKKMMPGCYSLCYCSILCVPLVIV